MLELVVVLGLLSASTPATRSEPPYVWSAWSDDVAFYGVPDTDDGTLTVFCDRANGLSIGGSLARDAPAGGRVPLTFSGQGFSTRRSAEVSECDGLCFSTPVKADDPAIKALLAGRSLTLDQAGDRWTVSGKGAARVLRPLIKACGVARRN